MALHFDRAEYARRIKATIAAMEKQKLDGLLMFQQESMYYLTGYDTFGFCFLQCLYLGTDGKLALLTRSADLRQAQHTSIIDDIRIWTDAAGAKPATQLRDMLQSLGAKGKRLGVWGYGRIGQLVAGYGRAFGMQVQVWGSEGSRLKALADGLEVPESRHDFFASSDVLSLHLRLNAAIIGIKHIPKPNRRSARSTRNDMIYLAHMPESPRVNSSPSP